MSNEYIYRLKKFVGDIFERILKSQLEKVVGTTGKKLWWLHYSRIPWLSTIEILSYQLPHDLFILGKFCFYHAHMDIQREYFFKHLFSLRER